MSSIADRHPKAYEIATTRIDPAKMSWIDNKADLLAIVDSITADVLHGHDLDHLDPFLLAILQDYVANVLVQLDADLGWDVPGQSDQFEDALLAFLGRRWVYFKATGRLR